MRFKVNHGKATRSSDVWFGQQVGACKPWGPAGVDRRSTCTQEEEEDGQEVWQGLGQAVMAGFLDNFRWPECECVDWGERRNAVASVVAGVLVSFVLFFFLPPHVFCLRKQKLHTSFQCFYSWAVISLLWPSDLCRPSVRCSSSRAGGSWSTRPCPTQPRKRWTTPSTPAASSPRWPSSCEWVG